MTVWAVDVADTGDASSAAAKAKAARQSCEGGAAELAAAPVWFSTTVEAESLPGTSISDSITDWRIVVAAPLILENQLPHKGSFLIWERPKVHHFLASLRIAPEQTSGQSNCATDLQPCAMMC